MPINFFSWLRDDSLERIGIPYDESQSERPPRRRRAPRPMDDITAANHNNNNRDDTMRGEGMPQLAAAAASPRANHSHVIAYDRSDTTTTTSHHHNNNNNNNEEEEDTAGAGQAGRVRRSHERRPGPAFTRPTPGFPGAGESVFRHWAPTMSLLDELSDPTGTADFTRNSSQRAYASSLGRSPPEGRAGVRRCLGHDLQPPYTSSTHPSDTIFSSHNRRGRNNNNNNNYEEGEEENCRRGHRRYGYEGGAGNGHKDDAAACRCCALRPYSHRRTSTMNAACGGGAQNTLHTATLSTSICFTCSGHPSDIVRFLSCVPCNLARRVSPRSGKGGRKGKCEETGPPPAQGPFSADLFSIILLYVDATSMETILQVGATCRFWRYYANYAPHWTYFRNERWRTRGVDLPRYVRAIVQKPKIVTRDEYCEERRKVDEHRRRSEIITGARHVRSCILLGLTVAAWLTVNYVVALLLGFLPTALRTDGVLGLTTFVCLFLACLLELVLVVTPLARHCLPYSKDTTMRLLAWSLFLVVFSVLFGVITSLALSRVQAERRVLSGPTLNFSMNAACTSYSATNAASRPSFALLPAPLYDLRWRPITMDEAEKTLEPFCLSGLGADLADSTYCFVLLFFDAFYQSAVFHDAAALHAGRDVGTHTALGFSPFEVHYPQEWTWCARLNRSQIVALTAAAYTDTVAPTRNAMYASDADWLDPTRRPRPDYYHYYKDHCDRPTTHNASATSSQARGSESVAYGSSNDCDDDDDDDVSESESNDEDEALVSYRCASDINRAVTEDIPGAAFAWFDNTNQWRWMRIPLVTTHRSTREAVQARRRHFTHYATTCYIISAVVWGLLFFAQVFFRSSANSILGVLTVIVLLLLNPLTMIIAGALCVRLSENDVMCGPQAGGALIGGGLALLFLLLTIYVSARG